MPSYHGKFVWYELMTTDAAGAAAFYQSVISCGAQDAGIPGMAYTFLTAGEIHLAGLMALPEEARKAGARPGWLGYVAVDDVDRSAAAVTMAGGAIHRAPADIPGVGRYTIVADPQGAMLALFKGTSAAPPPPPPPGTPGQAGWHELHAADWEAAFAFYARLFGWTKAEPFDMGAMGIYQLFAAGDAPVGGMMTKMPAVPAPFWLYYFNVDAIDAAAARATAAGGQILNGPHEVPGGGWIVQCRDPQGAMFALLASRR